MPRDYHKVPVFTARFDTDTKAKLERLAYEANVSMSEIVRRLIHAQ